jgi:hypothetical protein
LVKLGGHVEVVDLAWLAINRVENNERVDLEVSDCCQCNSELFRKLPTVQVDVDTVETDQEVGENILLGLGNVGKEGRNERFSVREAGVDRNQQLERFGIDISDFNTTLAGCQQLAL